MAVYSCHFASSVVPTQEMSGKKTNHNEKAIFLSHFLMSYQKKRGGGGGGGEELAYKLKLTTPLQGCGEA